MYIYQHLASQRPLDVVPGSFDSMNIMNIFMLINGISADLMAAFYAAGGQAYQEVLRLHEYFIRMWRMYTEAVQGDLIGMFGDYFAYHLETRTLRRIDMSVVDHGRGTRHNTHFVPSRPDWRQAREVRRLYRAGEYQILNDDDLEEFRYAWGGEYRTRRGHADE